MGLGDLLAVIWRWRFFILVTTLSAAIMAFFLCRVIRPIYETRAVVTVPWNNLWFSFSFFFPGPAAPGPRLLLPATAKMAQAPIMGFLKSRRLAEMVHEEYPERTVGQLMLWDTDFRLNKEFFFEIYARAHDPQKAYRLAQLYVEKFNELLSTFNLEYVEALIRDLNRQKGDILYKLKLAERELQKFKEKTRVVDLEAERQALISLRLDLLTRLADKNASLAATRKKLSALQENLSAEEKRTTAEVLSLISPVIADTRKRLLEAETRVAALSTELTPKHPDLIAAQEEAAHIRAELESQVRELLKSQIKPGTFYETLREQLINLSTQKVALEADLAALKQALDLVNRELMAFPSRETELEDLEETVQRYRDRIKTLALKIDELRAQRQRFLKPVLVVDPPEVPKGPVFPLVLVVVPVSLVLGFLAAVFFAVLAESVLKRRPHVP